METQRKPLLTWVREACQAGARLRQAGNVVGLSVRTVQRWQQADSLRDGRLEASHRPSHALNEIERQRILNVVNQPDYAALSPRIRSYPYSRMGACISLQNRRFTVY